LPAHKGCASQREQNVSAAACLSHLAEAGEGLLHPGQSFGGFPKDMHGGTEACEGGRDALLVLQTFKQLQAGFQMDCCLLRIVLNKRQVASSIERPGIRSVATEPLVAAARCQSLLQEPTTLAQAPAEKPVQSQR